MSVGIHYLRSNECKQNNEGQFMVILKDCDSHKICQASGMRAVHQTTNWIKIVRSTLLRIGLLLFVWNSRFESLNKQQYIALRAWLHVSSDKESLKRHMECVVRWKVNITALFCGVLLRRKQCQTILGSCGWNVARHNHCDVLKLTCNSCKSFFSNLAEDPGSNIIIMLTLPPQK